MTYKEDIEHSGNALSAAYDSLEYATIILPKQHAYEVAQLKRALQIIKDVRKMLKLAEYPSKQASPTES